VTPLQKTYAASGKVVNALGYPIKVLAIRNTHRVRVLITSSDQVLLLKSSIGSQKWSMPGGAVERGETALAAAVREVHEETSISLKVKDLTALGEKLVKIKASPFQYRLTQFAVTLPTPLKPQITRPFEIIALKWHRLAKLPKDHSPLLDQALELQIVDGSSSK